ncbi:MAG: isoprenylcysteine carboxylmethyltransferase family protein [Ancalomicrobiaceae bacterium]|nr:isoprenylcysteine carboxylmethyltransferase family protein [Ancalomicrobiaceae bacterium]
MQLTRIYPPRYFFLAIIVMVALNWVVPIASPIEGYWRLIALVPVAAGVVLNLDASRRFRLAATTILPFDHSSALVTSGTYRLTRNPIYLGMLLILAGIALALGSLSPWLAVAAFFLAIDLLFVPFEEQMLTLRFGTEYTDYKQKVRRWI